MVERAFPSGPGGAPQAGAESSGGLSLPVPKAEVFGLREPNDLDVGRSAA